MIRNNYKIFISSTWVPVFPPHLVVVLQFLPHTSLFPFLCLHTLSLAKLARRKEVVVGWRTVADPGGPDRVTQRTRLEGWDHIGMRKWKRKLDTSWLYHVYLPTGGPATEPQPCTVGELVRTPIRNVLVTQS